MAGQLVLVCAISGRALAQSARAAGFVPVVLDRFGDDDTRAAAAACATVTPAAESPFSARSLVRGAAAIAPPPLPLVYGSGFDGAPELLGRLAEGRELLGNAPAEVERVKDPFAFATICRRLGIPHPETAPGLPADRRGWLVKRRGGAGGSHVRDAATVAEPAPGDYAQRRVEGEAVSALLLGDGRRCRVLAMSRQWQQPHGRRHFSGTLFPAGVATGIDRSLREAAVAIGEAHALRGLASADFLLAVDGRFHLLEVNPRPGASLEAAELHLGVPLFGLHVAAARGRPPDALPVRRPGVAATEIVWADRDLAMPAGFRWPDWAGDHTPGATPLRRDDPVATVRAEAADAPAARALLAERGAILLGLLAKQQRSA